MIVLEKYGWVKIIYSTIDLIATGGRFGQKLVNRLIMTSGADHLGIRAGVRWGWAAVRVAVHDAVDSCDTESDEGWEESAEVVMTFTGPPFFYVDDAVGWGVDPTLHDLGVPAGTYRILVRANGVSKAARQPIGLGDDVEKVPQPETLLQQYRLDIWPVGSSVVVGN